MAGADAMVVVHSYDNEVEAGHDHAYLESLGIRAELSGRFHREIGPVRLMVRAEDVERASEELRAIGRNVNL